jgi:hypothetical protein
VSATLTLTPGREPLADPLRGTLTLESYGVKVPHPPEVTALVGDASPQLVTQLTLDGARQQLTLSALRVTLGKLTLDGAGTVTRGAEEALIDVTLHGKVPCRTVGPTAIGARLPKGLARALGTQAAAAALSGDVGVTLHVVAHSSQLGTPTVEQQLQLGCSVALPGLGELAKLPAVKELGGAVEKVGTELGSLLEKELAKAKEREKTKEKPAPPPAPSARAP